MIDSTVIRAHQHATGVKGGQDKQALGRSCGRFSSKLHACCDAPINPIRFILTKGQAGDSPQTIDLLENLPFLGRLADKAYETDLIIELVLNHGALTVIPPKSNRVVERGDDKVLYKERNGIERLFNRLKHYRRITTRYDKTSSSYLGFLALASAMLELS
jgi:transposase